MSAFASIKQGLQEAVAHNKGQPVAVRVHRLSALSVKAVRETTCLTQAKLIRVPR
jgi:putative transcriptional regulator